MIYWWYMNLWEWCSSRRPWARWSWGHRLLTLWWSSDWGGKSSWAAKQALCFVTHALSPSFLGQNRRPLPQHLSDACSIPTEMSSARGFHTLALGLLSSLCKMHAYSQEVSSLLWFLEKLSCLCPYGTLLLLLLVPPIAEGLVLKLSFQMEVGNLTFSLCLVLGGRVVAAVWGVEVFSSWQFRCCSSCYWEETLTCPSSVSFLSSVCTIL